MPLAARLRQHPGWPLVLLLASLGVATLAAVQAQRDAALLVLSPILHKEMHSLARWPDAADLVGYRAGAVARCRCDPIFRPAPFMAWSLGADTLGTVGAPLDAEARRALLDTLAPHVRAAPAGVRAGLVVARVRETSTLVAFGLMPTTRGDTIVYAFTFDSASVTAGFRDIARRSELLPPAVTRGLSDDSLLALSLAPPGGPTFFEDNAALAVTRDGVPVSLTPTAYELMLALVRRNGAVATRVELLSEVRGTAADVVTRTVDSHMAELRRKLEDDPGEPRHLLTVWKAGYRFTP